MPYVPFLPLFVTHPIVLSSKNSYPIICLLLLIFVSECMCVCGGREGGHTKVTVKSLNIGTPRPATIVVLNIKQFNFTRK